MATKKKTTKKKSTGKKRMGASGGNNLLTMSVVAAITAVGTLWGVKKAKDSITDPVKLQKFNDYLKWIYGAAAGAGLLAVWKIRNPWIKGIGFGMMGAGAIGVSVEEGWISIGSMDEVPLIAAFRQRQELENGGRSSAVENSASRSNSRSGSVAPVIAGSGMFFNQRRGR